MTVSSPAECTCPMRRNPASLSSIAPSLWKTKSRPTSRTSRSIGEGGGTRDGAFDASLAGLKRSGLDRRVIHESLCRGSRTVGFSTSTIFVVARPPAAALPVCSTSRRCAWRIIRLSGGGIGARSVRTYRNDFSVIFWQRAYVEVLQPPELRPRELPATVHT
jgi:hypothetical protein